MWIKTTAGELVNSKNFHSFEVRRAENSRCFQSSNRQTIYHTCPPDGFVTCAWARGGLQFLTAGLTETAAEFVLDQLFQAIGEGAKTFDVNAKE
jgi:hypothetical protein